MSLIYKILPRSLWDTAISTGEFQGAGIDLTDGYIHFSTASQSRETASRHFAGQSDLMLVAVDGNSLGDALKYEASRGGDMFPHLFAALKTDSVLWAKPLPLSANGSHVFPDEMQ